MVDTDQHPPYKGSYPGLVIAIDVGTTYSSLSYAILEPGRVPEVHDVTKYKGQASTGWRPKVPTVLLYDSSGILKACGAETNEVAMEEENDEGLIKVQRLQLLLRPPSMAIPADDLSFITLPNGMTAVDIWGDFLRYMKNSVRDYIVELEINGTNIWNALGESATYILTHPNGWRDHQQDKIRQAAIRGNLVPHAPDVWSRIEFLSEGEANLHGCIMADLVKSTVGVGRHVIVCDAGASTIDVSSFRVVSVRPYQLQEAMESESRLAGSALVMTYFKSTVNDHLANSKYGAPEYIAIITRKFEETHQMLFEGPSQVVRVKFGSQKDSDRGHDIHRGYIKLPGQLVAACFESSIREAVDAIRKHLPTDGSESYVLVVGDLARTSWLFREVRRRLADRTPSVSRGDSQLAKMVSHGAVLAHLDRLRNREEHTNVALPGRGTSLKSFTSGQNPLEMSGLRDVLPSPMTVVMNRIRHPEISRERISITGFLGNGGFGEVHSALLDGSRAVAVKSLRPYGDAEQRELVAKRFVRELDVWARLDHPNIHPLIGFYLAPDHSVAWLISPLCTNGNATSYVKKTHPVELDRVKLIMDTVKGLQYMHESNPSVYHGDIKADNVLITADIRAVFCDFGLAKVRGPKTGLTTSNTSGTVHYLSPEIALLDDEPTHPEAGEEARHPRLTPERDIWAWGCLVLEIMTERIPYAQRSLGGVYKDLRDGVPPAVVNKLNVAEPIAYLMEKCWSFVPEERPSVSVCLQSVNDYHRTLSQ